MSASAFQSLQALFAPTDEQLMWRVQAGEDHAAFADLVRRWEAPIQRLCARLTGDEHRAQDLAQEVFARIFAHRDSFKQGAKFSTYLWRVALNHTYSELRRARNWRETLLDRPLNADTSGFDDFAADSPSPAEEAACRETGDAVRAALSLLPEHYRSVLVLRHYENLKFREIAEILGLPEGTVKTRMTEALSEMARLLRQPLDLKIAPPPNRRTRPTQNLTL